MTENNPVEQENLSLEALYNAFKPLKNPFTGGGMYGSMKRSKMIEFCKKTNVTNEIIDGYMRIPHRKLEHESKEDFKMRSVFQKDLLRFRENIYNYLTIE